MGRYRLNLRISTADFPELGSPFFEPEGKVKVARKDKSDYDGFRQSAAIALPTAVSHLNTASTGREGQSSIISAQQAEIDLPFEDEVPKTYTFLGMDISPDFDAVIKFGSGCAIVAHMCDRERMADYVPSLLRHVEGRDIAVKKTINLINSVDENVYRKVATSLKTGTFYSLLKKFSTKDAYAKEDEDYSSAFSDFISMIQKDLTGDREDGDATGFSAKFNSIILNLIGDKEEKIADIQATTSDGSLDDKVAKAFFGCLLSYWSYVGEIYSYWKSELAALDLWSDLYRRTVGDRDFNKRFQKCITLVDDAAPGGTGAIQDRMISFAGIAVNGGISDDNVVRDRACEQVGKLSRMMFTTSMDQFRSLDLEDVLRSNIDTRDIEEVYSLSPEEMQALSVLDSLRYVDEDAAVCRASYDMDDPDQRGLFVKSAIRSYERNFREFKPARHYDVTEALANMVERGDIENNTVVSQQVLTGEPEHDLAVQGDIVTFTKDDLKALVNLADLRKVLKLVNKSLGKVQKNFVENS